MSFKMLRNITLGLLLAVTFTSAASAGSVLMKFDKIALGRSPAGFYQWQMIDQNDIAMPVDANNKFLTFCIEYDQHVSSKAQWYEIVDLADAPNVPTPMGETNAFLLRELFGRHYDEIDTRDEAVSFHHAIWNITVGRATNNAQAIEWLRELEGPESYDGKLASLKVLHHDNYQDQVFLVPLPASIWAGMSMLGGIGVIRKIRRCRR